MDYESGDYYISNLNEVFKFIKHNYLIELDYIIYEIDKMNIVLNIMDDLIMYIGVRDKKYIFIEELTYNNYFKINKSKFFPYNKKYDFPILTKYRFFDGNFPEEDNYFSEKSSFSYVNNKLPKLKLKERREKWEGILYNFIIYELNYNNKKGYAITFTDNLLPLKFAHNSEKSLEEKAIQLVYTYPFSKGLNSITYQNTLYSKEFIDITKNMESDNAIGNYNPKSFVGGRQPLYDNHLKFFSLSNFIKILNEINIIQENLLEKCRSGFFDSISKIVYEVGNYKWKSEELMYKCVKEVFKDCTVIQQYRPFYLSTQKGQMSYDVYVLEKKIAFEYQGKQHYEPVEFFGGQKNFENQKKRDELKRAISKKNKIKLIEISYKEDISVDLIRNKVNI